MTVPGACSHTPDGDAGPPADLRTLALLALDRLDPLLARLRAAEAAGTTSDSAPRPSGDPCPLCTALAVVRGERPEIAGRLAEHGAAVVAALRDALAAPPADAPADSSNGGATDRATTSSTSPVQHIPVDRDEPVRPARAVQHIAVDRQPAAGGAAQC